MIESGLKELYQRTAQQYGRKEPNPSEFDSWKNVLGEFSYSDLDSALRRWANDATEEDFTHRPRGARMPQPIELKASINTFSNATKEQFKSCGKCMSGWVKLETPKGSSVKRCECFVAWIAVRKTV